MENGVPPPDYGYVIRSTGRLLHLPPLEALLRWTRSRAAEEGTTSAIDMLPSDIPRIIHLLPLEEGIIFTLAWKTCSRWGDFTMAQLYRLNRQEILVLFNCTKAEKGLASSAGKREDHQSICRWTTAMPPFIASRLPLLEAITLKVWDTQKLNSFLRRLPFPAVGNYTAHSLKQGAVRRLLDLAIEGKVDPIKIPLLMKHADHVTAFMGKVGLSYANSVEKRLRVARITQTDRLTALL
jgi:hypothetical protein